MPAANPPLGLAVGDLHASLLHKWSALQVDLAIDPCTRWGSHTRVAYPSFCRINALYAAALVSLVVGQN